MVQLFRSFNFQSRQFPEMAAATGSMASYRARRGEEEEEEEAGPAKQLLLPLLPSEDDADDEAPSYKNKKKKISPSKAASAPSPSLYFIPAEVLARREEGVRRRLVCTACHRVFHTAFGRRAHDCPAALPTSQLSSLTLRTSTAVKAEVNITFTFWCFPIFAIFKIYLDLKQICLDLPVSLSEKGGWCYLWYHM